VCGVLKQPTQTVDPDPIFSNATTLNIVTRYAMSSMMTSPIDVQ